MNRGRRLLAELFSSNPAVARLLRLVERGIPVTVTGAAGASRAMLAAEMANRLRRPVVLILENPDEMKAVAEDARTICDLRNTSVFGPELVHAPSEQKTEQPSLVVADRDTLEAHAPVYISEEQSSLLLEPCKPNTPDGVVEWLEDARYERVDLVTEPGEYATRGGIVDIFPEGHETPVRCEFLDDAIISLRTFDPLTQRSVSPVDRTTVATRRRPVPSVHTLAELLPPTWVTLSEAPVRGLSPLVTLTTEDKADFNLRCLRVPSYIGNFALLRAEMASSGLEYFVACRTEERCSRLKTLLPAEARHIIGPVSSGFVNQAGGYALLTERELYGAPLHRTVRHRFKGVPIDNLVTLRPGDHVVHINYGIGLFEGTKRIAHAGTEKDYIVLRYQGSDRVYVPVESLGLLDRYIGAGDAPVKLDRIGSRSWLLAKARAARASAEYAEEMLELEARRSVARGTAFAHDAEWQAQLEASFPYTETEDQLAALKAVRLDMESPRPMERLVCGDVGYGKTEVALRAAFKAVAGAKQVAVLVPTTILCYQHYSTFRERLEPFPVRVEMLSRFVAPARRRAIAEDVAAGKVDIVIGTHVLLGSAIRFRDLGLLIIDEEQKFGVRQKEKIKKLRTSVDVLSLSATPVPRTLYLSLSGLRDISTINTPPAGRREILTEVAPWNDDFVVRYVEREIGRGGQVFFVHNRIASLPTVTRRLKRLFPNLDMAVAHGQMPERQLEEIYLGFAAGEHQMLLSTAIIESGLDLPNVNTIIVDSADKFGLSDLHQLRGRVGRSGRQAYALFIVPGRQELTDEARKRLSALLAYSRLGSGFRLALRDLEIRGAGDLLGTRQHGQVARVGLNLYAKMLKEAAAKLRGESLKPEPELALEANAFLPKEYIADGFERIALYRRMLGIEDESELAEFREELVDRFGRYPAAAEGLFKIARVRILARKQGLLRVELKSGKATVVGPNRTETFTADLEGLLSRLASGHF